MPPKILLSFLFTCLLALPGFAQKKKRECPKLVVGIVVDQMRWDYLYKYYGRYSADGFRRLLNDGYECRQAYINYLPSYTAPGHACIYTGSVPSIHGIAGNDWIDRATGRRWYCTEDTTARPVGGSVKAGSMSPANLLTTTITDELRLATGFRSRVFGISLKDRGCILPAGHLGNGAYWYDDSTGNLMSSSFYGPKLPTWLDRFNNRRLGDSLMKKDWTTLYPTNTYKQSIADDNAFEGVFKGEEKPVFPHKASVFAGYPNLRRLPAGNTYSVAAAMACIEGERLGQKEFTDFFCLSLSTPDYIGHQFAPDAVEVEDQYLRLDQDLAAFLRFLDKTVGKGKYLLFLTADHGAAQNPAYLKSLKVPAGYLREANMQTRLDSVLKQRFQQDSLIRAIDNFQIFLNDNRIAKLQIERKQLKSAIAEFILQQEGIAYVADLEDLNGSALPEPIRTMIVNGYHRRRSGVIQVIPDPGWFFGGANKTGTTHSSWQPYDTHIPLVWFGWNMPKGKHLSRRVYMQDIAATLAELLYVPAPNGCIGQPIVELTTEDD